MREFPPPPTNRRSADRRVHLPGYGIDRRGTGPRSEVRFFAGQRMAATARGLAEANLQLTDSETPWYTTTYCDTSDRALYHEAVGGTGSLLRLREYHDRRPEQALASQRIWVEWKDEARERSQKQRLIIRPVDVGPFLRGEPLDSGDLQVALQHKNLFASGLRPVVITQCRRVAYASRRDEVRISFDHDLTYYTPEPASDVGFVPCSLGPIVGREAGFIVEVKWQAELPDWATALLDTLHREGEDRPSKFVVAMNHLLSRTAPQAAATQRPA